MKNLAELSGRNVIQASDRCRSLTEWGCTALVKQEEAVASEVDGAARQWSGRPGEDLFFNNWKLLF